MRFLLAKLLLFEVRCDAAVVMPCSANGNSCATSAHLVQWILNSSKAHRYICKAAPEVSVAEFAHLIEDTANGCRASIAAPAVL